MVNISCRMDSSFMRSSGSTWLVSSMLGTTVMRTKATLYGHWPSWLFFMPASLAISVILFEVLAFIFPAFIINLLVTYAPLTSLI